MSEDTGAEGVETAPAETQDTPDPIMARLDQLSESIAPLHEMYQSFQAQNQEPEEEEYDEYPLDEDDEGYDQQEAQRALQQMIEEGVQKKLEPHLQEQALDKRDQMLAGLEQQYPNLGDEKVARAVIDGARRMAAEIGLPNDVEQRPEFVRLMELVYKANTADERAAQETPAGSTPRVALEQNGGAAPANDQDDTDDLLMAAVKSMNSKFL